MTLTRICDIVDSFEFPVLLAIHFTPPSHYTMSCLQNPITPGLLTLVALLC
jgi:hypothetical protein